MENYSSILEQTLRQKRDIERRTESIIWAFINLSLAGLLYYDVTHDILSNLLCDVIKVPRKWLRYADLFLICVCSVNTVIDFFTYLKLSYLYTTVFLTRRQKQLLAVDDATLGFSGPSPCQIPELLTDLSPHFKSTSLMTPSLFNLSSSSRCSTDFNASSSSWQLYRSFQPSFSNQTQSPQVQTNLSDTNYESPDSSEYYSINDEASLLKYLKDYDQAAEMNSFERSESPEATRTGSFWNLGHSFLDFSSQLRKYSYQLSTRLPQTSISLAGSDSDFPAHMSGDDIWSRLGVTQSDLYTWTKNLRQWLALTILDRLVSEIAMINETLQCMGSSDLQVGEASLNTLRKVFLTKSNLIPSLTVLLPYLEISTNQEYLVQRIKELARGGCMSEFVWNGGGEFKGRPWADHLPVDSMILIHLFCTYLDSRLPPHPNYPDGKTFTSQCLVRSPEKPVLSKYSMYIYQTRLVPPHFKLIIGDEVWDVGKGRNNLFHTILLFLYQIKIREKGMLGRVNLGLSGVNILWILDPTE